MVRREDPPLAFDRYRELVASIPIGKHLPNAVYVHADGLAALPAELIAFLARVQTQVELPGFTFNVLKLHRDAFKVSLLSYPDFFPNPHPPLVASATIELQELRVRQKTYAAGSNRPVLHRKETFLPSDHPRYAEFRALTEAEEQLGLFENATRIGFERQWGELLESKGVTIRGHKAIRGDEGAPAAASGRPQAKGTPRVARCKTAISRFGLSRPIQYVLKYDMLKKSQRLLDYGCGLGDDIRGLEKLGFQASGWDPVHYPEGGKQPAAVVNLGFVINVIEDPDERVEVVRDAFSLAEQMLVVSAQIDRPESPKAGRPYRDGVLTSKGTFQRYFSHDELGRFLEDSLHTTAVSAGPGVYFVFKDPAAAQGFLRSRSARPIDFFALRDQLFGDKPRRAPAQTTERRRTFYEQHQELLDSYWSSMVQAGRPLGPGEFERFDELARLGLTGQRARNLFGKLFGESAFDQGFMGKNRALIEAFWDRMIHLGRVPLDTEFERSLELQERGISAEQLKNLFLRQHGPGSLRKQFRERHQELIQDFWEAMVRFGRLPQQGEYHRWQELKTLRLTPRHLHDWFVEEFGEGVFERAVKNRKDDLLVYLALANFRRKVPFRELPATLQADLRTFFGSYQRAIADGQMLLFSLGRPGEVAAACDDFGQGYAGEKGLVFHRSLQDQLPPSLRVVLGCAGVLEGDVTEADLIKIHKRGSKVTLLFYEDFERQSFPVLVQRVKIDLAAQSVRHYDHSTVGPRQVLVRKYLYVSAKHPRAKVWTTFHQRVERLVGEFEYPHVPLEELQGRLARTGHDLRLRNS